MRRILSLLFVILLAACGLHPLEGDIRLALPRGLPSSEPATLLPNATLAVPTVGQQPSPLPSPSPEPTLATPVLPASGWRVQTHPEGPLYVGDRVSFEVIPGSGQNFEGQEVSISLVRMDAEEPIGQAGFSRFGIEGRLQATLAWAWDTSALAGGDYVLRFSVQPGGDSWEQTFRLLPRAVLPPRQAGAAWAAHQSACCRLYYITGTAAERDLDPLLMLLDTQAKDVAARFRAAGLQTDFSVPITVTLLSRVLGHGGFAGGEIHVSYLDRNYAGGLPEMVLHHEMVHILDASLGGDLRPSLLVEGLAVYMTGGHFKPGPLLPRAAALLQLQQSAPAGAVEGWYLPLRTLADQFYASQHEIGYLQAGALVAYMVERYGWPAFDAFYRDIHPPDNGSQAQAIDDALQVHFQITLADLERAFLAALRAQTVPPALREDVRLTVQYYDTLRRYQRAFDPSAYFMTAWLLDTGQMRQAGIVQDYLRHPATLENITLEVMLIAANQAWIASNLLLAGRILQAVNAVLEAAEKDHPAIFWAHPLAWDYAEVVLALLENGLEPQRVLVEADRAQAWVTGLEVDLIQVSLSREASGWVLRQTGRERGASQKSGRSGLPPKIWHGMTRTSWVTADSPPRFGMEWLAVPYPVFLGGAESQIAEDQIEGRSAVQAH